MNVQEAIEWADKNSSSESLARLRSRQVTKVLADEVRKLREMYFYASAQAVRLGEEVERLQEELNEELLFRMENHVIITKLLGNPSRMNEYAEQYAKQGSGQGPVR